MTDFPPVDGVEHRFVEVRGMRMHVAEAGAGEPLLLVHGWPQHWYQWRGVIERLADVRRLIVPDLRGFGWSDAPAGPIEPDVFVDDLIALLDALDIEQTDLAGHDWGGYTSLLLAARHPERLRKVVAFSTPHPWIKITPRLALETWRAWYAVLLAAGLMERSTRLAEWIIRREGVDPAPYVDRVRGEATHPALSLLPADVARHGEGRHGGTAARNTDPALHRRERPSGHPTPRRRLPELRAHPPRRALRL